MIKKIIAWFKSLFCKKDVWKPVEGITYGEPKCFEINVKTKEIKEIEPKVTKEKKAPKKKIGVKKKGTKKEKE